MAFIKIVDAKSLMEMENDVEVDVEVMEAGEYIPSNGNRDMLAY
jgi:hypothetical protein